MARNGSALSSGGTQREKEVLSGAFFWLSAFYFVYCARPEDWIPGLKYAPLAKITSFFAFGALLLSVGKAKRSFQDLPKEARFLIVMVVLMFAAAVTSPVWPGGAFFHTIDFSKVVVAWVLTFLLITTFARLRRIIFIQAASVAVIAVVSIAKGHNTPRLDGVLGGIYSNPNDLAFAIVLSLPFCLAFLLTATTVPKKLAWAVGMLVMTAALFLTASRAGFIDLVIMGGVCLWHFGVKGKRPQLIIAATLVVGVLLIAAGGLLRARFSTIYSDEFDPEMNSAYGREVNSAYGSFEERKLLYYRSLEGIEHHPLLGIGPGCFPNYSEIWRDVHNAYLQIGVEGGIPVMILYLVFLGCGFANLRKLRKRQDLDMHTTLFVGALHSSLVGFIVGAFFAPEAYQFFPYFAVAQTSVLVAIVKEQESTSVPKPELKRGGRRLWEIEARSGRISDLTPVR